MADLDEATPATCGWCRKTCVGAHPRKGASRCGECDQWVTGVGLVKRLISRLRRQA